MTRRHHTATLESIFRRPACKTRGLRIDKEYLSHLHFTNYIHCTHNYAFIQHVNYNKCYRN